MTVWVVRIPAGGPAETVSYVIDTALGNITHTILTDDHFATVAGSDYALPFNGSINPVTGSSNDWDFFLPYNDSFGYASTNIQNLKLPVQNGGLYGTLSFPPGGHRSSADTHPDQ